MGKNSTETNPDGTGVATEVLTKEIENPFMGNPPPFSGWFPKKY